MNYTLTPEVQGVALSLYEALDCPRSVTAAILLRYGELDQLVTLEVDPFHYNSAFEFGRANAASVFLKKFDDGKSHGELESGAVEKWLWAEKQCYRTNRRLTELPYLASTDVGYGRVWSILDQARKNLLRKIGYGPGSRGEDLARFGPGATVSDVGTRTTMSHKMSSTPTLTRDAWPYLVPWSGTRWATAVASRNDQPQFVRGNLYFTVPKTATSLRSCAKEPSLNVYYQLGHGRALRRALHGWVDLNYGQDHHRRLAKMASESGEFATLDLSSASDTLALGLVSLLLPKGWFDALSDLRSPVTTVGDTPFILEKFSSMGNGYTFELETAIFCSLLSAVPGISVGTNAWVYGDDIIVPTTCVSNVVAILQYCGFTLNKSKSFAVGPFRESCGGDFYDGFPVRGAYLREDLHEPQIIISCANKVRRLGFDLYGYMPAALLRTWFAILDLLPSRIRSLRGPRELGDLVIWDEPEHWKWRWRGGIRWFRVYRPVNRGVVRWDRFDGPVQLASALNRVALVSHKGRLYISGRGATGYKIGRAAFS